MKNGDLRMTCREARAGLRCMISAELPGSNIEIERHIGECASCAAEYELLELERVVLDASAAMAPVVPGPEFFAALRARIQREAEWGALGRYTTDDSWANVVWLTARQLVPAMAILLALIIGATLIWGGRSDSPQEAAMMIRPSERVLFHDIYDTPQPTTDDVLETLVAVEEKDNGK